MSKIALLALLAASRAHPAVDWKPVAPEELSLKAPRVDKDAPAEILSREIHFQLALTI